MAGEVTPRRIDRAALERIIQRAAELQAGDVDTGEGLTEQDVLKLGSEVGIPGRFLRQALDEETTRGGVERAHGLLARWAGPRLVGASRVVPGDKATVERALEQWMTESEALAVKRRLPDRTLWEAQKGLIAQMKRGFGVGGKSYHLARSVEVSHSVTALEAGYCHVALSADVSNSRGGVERAHGLMARWAGPRLVGASRVVPGDKATLERAIEQWMTESEALAVKRRLPDRTLWEAQKGLFAQMKRGLGVGGKSYHLAGTVEVSVSVAALEEGYCHVTLSADVSNSQHGALSGATAVAVTGILLSSVLIAFLHVAMPGFLLLPGAIGVGIGAGIPKVHRRRAERVQLALEQILDGLERGEIRTKPAMPGPRVSAFVRIADEIKRSLGEVADAARQVPPPAPKPPSLPRGKD